MRGKLRFILGFLLLLMFANIPAIKAGSFPEKTTPPQKLTVYFFLAETCPISQFYTLTLKELHKEFASEDLQFKGIFPNTESTAETIADFKTKYQLPFALETDPGQKLSKNLKAMITPEAIIKNETTGAIVYQGRIDDSYFRVGKRRPVAREHDLKNALTELKKGQPVTKSVTSAVGCYITFLP